MLRFRKSIMRTLIYFKSRLSFAGVWLSVFLAFAIVQAKSPVYEPAPADPSLAKFKAVKAPAPGKLWLRPGDQLAICGDSITEQKMYSRIIETYLTACTPDLHVATRQYGWSGETAEGFLRRMTNDCLRFHPTIATTCYGMNDFKYRPYDDANASWYVSNYTAVARAFKGAGARVVLGSPGCVGKVASWVKSGSGTVEDHNLSLCAFRNHALDIARQERLRFADVFWPLFTAGFEARQKYGAEYAIAGKDGVHPDWSGQLVMAYAYLRALGLDGDLGTISVNLKRQKAKAAGGHEVTAFSHGQLTIISHRYPFCAAGPLSQDNSMRSAMTLVPFNQQLNRLLLMVKGATAPNYRITWGPESHVYTAAQLAHGVNLADDFTVNPFSEPFKKVDAAVAAKQAFETKQIKEIFHGAEGRADMTAAVARTEKERTVLVTAIHNAFTPVTHTLTIEAQ
jgi:hypothetical protein